ncbi:MULTISPECIES: filamentous hemagglutinin N-terminal domain-containing protein [unclassified Moorena]|uniref:two-partner secretion domain-containing protein n=1 Tax=unclassified Moorena TaxID=2683338 RepID=UPI0014016379|nr:MULTISPECIES: filamentous hemagglutinin N-terminal domain-containing protein [unclassified Moorena]NEO13121.1 filamentous hemagglutinin N-terminal domain-containing protein [Moorena sp. SIO3E8]NEP98139.1 filamentous hemagglutinin N-terminal domain-containing protein [Moorena sp. SIO3F7]
MLMAMGASCELIICLTTCLAWGFSAPVLAEIIPDGSLRNEASKVTPNVEVKGALADLIEGGATRGENLFHSFADFNVGELQRVYFANPSGIQRILTRVTGSNLSNIQGTLGVDGAANLFLLNPNGIVFGPNASLDVAGSFFASTANSLVFGDGQEFSATSPQAPPLLTINITPGLQYGKYDPRSTIKNAGNLAVGQDLTLAAGNLDLQGQLDAGKNLTLFGEDTVTIRDSVAQPFRAYSGGLLLIQGNQSIDIAAHNHTDSGLFAGADLRLRSANPIAGDAHYTAGGNISIEQLDGLPGNLVSTDDPIILTNGDVSLGNYTGASLHILAGGSVTVGDIEINSTDTTDNAISPNNSNPFLASLANVTLSDQARTSFVIDGSSQPTLDIRAGIDWTLLGGLPGNTDSSNLGSNLGTAATSADIEIGEIEINAPNGLVLLTNQYQANPSLVSETLKISSLLTGDGTIANDNGTVDKTNQRFSGNGGEVLIDYRGGIDIRERIDASSASGKAGDITVLTNDQLSLDGSFIISNTFGTEKGGDITIDTGSLLATDGAQIETSTFGKADAGKITIVADDTVTFEGFKGKSEGEKERVNNRTGILNIIRERATGNSGGISITTGSLFVNGGAQLQARVGDIDLQGTGRLKKSKGDSGDINIFARDTVSFRGRGAVTSVEGQGTGTAGDINIQARSVSVTNTSLQSNLIGRGSGGSVNIRASDSVILDGGQNSILTRVNRSGKADDGKNGGGNVDIETRSLYLTNGARIVASTFGKGNAGNVTIKVAEDIVFDGVNNKDQTIASGVLSEVKQGAIGNGGKVEIEANSISITNRAKLDSSTAGVGNAGPITISTNQLTLRDRGEISAATSGPGNAGNISVTEADSVVLTNDSNILSKVEPTSSGNGGKIEIWTDSLSLTNGSTIATRTQGFNPVKVVEQVLQEPNTTYNQAVLGDNPIVYWSLDETSGSTAFNATGNGFNGTYEGGVTQGVPGISGTAGEFNGNNDTAVDIGTVQSGSDLDISNQSFTVEAWIKPNEIGERQAYFGIHKRIKSDNDKSESLYFRLNENASVAFGDFPNDLETPDNIIEVDTWYHVVASYDKDSDTNTIFVNGREINRNNQGFFNGEDPRILIGTWPNIGDQSFNGVIDEVAVYNTALSPETVAQHYLIGQRSLGAPIDIGESGANAGKINIHANSITISGVSPTNNNISSGLLSDSSGELSGQARDITINTDSLKVEDGGIITVTSDNGIAGNLDITANSLLLNNGRLEAKTAGIPETGESGANITLDVSDWIVMLNESLISAEALDEATGGNITIDTNLLIAFPPTGPNGSDIIAKADQGQGGEITIDAEDVRLIEERRAIRGNGTNDIDASSDSGPQGIVTINTGNIDPSRGLDQLPINLTDPSSLIVASCPRSGKISVDELGEFIVTGRGGIPASPLDPIIGQTIIADWVTLDDQTLSETDHNLDNNQTLAPSTEKNSKPKRIVEAQGWMTGPDGTIILTSFPTDTTSPPKPWYHYLSCRDLN